MGQPSNVGQVSRVNLGERKIFRKEKERQLQALKKMDPEAFKEIQKRKNAGILP